MSLQFYVMLHQFQTISVPLDFPFWEMKMLAPGLFLHFSPPLYPLSSFSCTSTDTLLSQQTFMFYPVTLTKCVMFCSQVVLQNITSESRLIFMFIDGILLLIIFCIKTLCQWKENAFGINIERLLLFYTPLIA